MIVTDFSRRALLVRREARKLGRDGWQHVPEPDSRIVRGALWDHVITDVRIDAQGKGLWIKTGPEKAGNSAG